MPLARPSPLLVSGLLLAPGLLVLGPLACDRSPAPVEPASRRYLRVVEDSSLSVDQGLALCRDLGDRDLEGDCLLALASHESRRGGLAALVCEEMEAGLWQDECWFEAAESVARRRDRAGAAQLCLKAGRFSDECGQHLWQGALRATIAPAGRAGPVPEFAEALPRARMVYDAWAPLLAEGTDMEERFWRRFYQNGFERRGWIDLGRCDALEQAERAPCRAAGTQLFEGRIATDLAFAQIPLCLTTDMDARIGQALRASSDPDLELALDRQRQERCRSGTEASGG